MRISADISVVAGSCIFAFSVCDTMMTRSGNLLLLAKVALNKPKPICSEVSVQTDPVKFSSAEDADVTSGQPGKPILLDRSGNCGHDYVRPNETDVTDVPKNSGTSLVDSSCQADLSETLDGESASLDALNPPISNILEEIVQVKNLNLKIYRRGADGFIF